MGTQREREKIRKKRNKWETIERTNRVKKGEGKRENKKSIRGKSFTGHRFYSRHLILLFSFLLI